MKSFGMFSSFLNAEISLLQKKDLDPIIPWIPEPLV